MEKIAKGIPFNGEDREAGGAVLKDWKEKGNEVPADLFNVLDGNRTSITNKK